MHLFKSHSSTGFTRRLALYGGPDPVLTGLSRRLHEGFTCEKNPVYMHAELDILVLLLHIGGIVYLLRSDVPAIPATLMEMQVSLVASPPVNNSTASPAPSASKKPPAPKTPVKKPLAAKKPPVVKKPSEIKQPEANPRPQQNPAPAAASIQTNAAPARSSNPIPESALKTKTESFIEANYRVNYQLNPHPEYPRIARSRRWQGKVLLRVRVSATGFSENVTVHQSSGREPLDSSAVEAVKKWKFIPARRGDTPVASSVIVPIQFTLNN